MCKHSLKSGCVYCHGAQRQSVNVNGTLNPKVLRRDRRALNYALRVEQAMVQEGPLAQRERTPSGYRPIGRSMAKWLTGYAGN